MARKPLAPFASIVVSTVVGMAFFLGGYWLCIEDEHEAYGWVMFVLMPIVTGFAVGAVTRRSACLIVGCVTTCILSLAALVACGAEGYICCLMALPLLAVALLIGALLGYWLRGQYLDHGDHVARNALLVLLVCPLLMAAGNEAEKPWRGTQRSETFASEVLLPTSPAGTWEMLVRMPSMDGLKPFLLQIGLPVPSRCTLSADAVGGKRICYFDQGVIEMEVTNWQPPETVGMRITKNTLPGRRWLTFLDANYELIPVGEGTRVTRRTTIASRLYPRWYWRPFEAWGVVSEHEFVLSSLAKSSAD